MRDLLPLKSLLRADLQSRSLTTERLLMTANRRASSVMLLCLAVVACAAPDVIDGTATERPVEGELVQEEPEQAVDYTA